jgi:hypothetical protein
METFLTIISAWLFIAFAVHAAAAYFLLKASKGSEFRINALNERGLVALVATVKGAALASLGGNRIFGWGWNDEIVVLILAGALAVGVLPSVIWLWMYFTNRFGEHGEITNNGNSSTTR